VLDKPSLTFEAAKLSQKSLGPQYKVILHDE
jgi:hypothetical protein